MKIFNPLSRRDRGTTVSAEVGRYKLMSVIGRGASAQVFRARDTVFNRYVAVKVFDLQPPGTDAAQQERELRILASLNHPGIVSLLDAGVDLSDASRPRAFLVIDLASADDLRTTMRTMALTALQVTSIGLDVADALRYIHERGIVHRDISPANVLLTRYGSSATVHAKLGDFGIAIDFSDAAFEASDSTSGTAAYVSPEQVMGTGVGTASDIYSLGLVLLECFTGRLAFAPMPRAVDTRLTQDPVIPVDLPPGWLDLLTAMTQRAAHRRPTADDVCGELQRIQQGRVGRHRLDPGISPQPFETMEA